ncbi:hypothetical protein HPB52_000379 [Rhipicephalus sanguineus]|uniref:CCHC-type domain-containing protein n=1 Tax=Rhipicephalus sanguineus TaxID=34632 RepID=A0A9D4PT71_RHISA|nr:hypothetical protein HPB52_000379 [Rhipicephalus sanguineus]
MAYQVHGEDISEEEFSQDQGWQSAGARRAGAKTRTADSNEPSPQPGSRRGKLGGAALKSKVLRAGKMPPLPRDDIKIVIRPRGGLNISKIGAAAVADAILAAAGISQEDLCHDTLCPNLQQNIMVASTPKRENASRNVRMKQILISGKVHELSAYETAPHSTCKGVIRNIPLQDDPDVIDAKIVNTNNPFALAAKRIAQTGTVIVAFDGYRVPNFVRYGPVLMQCSLYRKQIDVCYACGRLGHRADVCPTPGDMICRGCVSQAPMTSMCVPPSASYVVASISRLAKTVLEGSRSRTSCVVVAVNAPKWLVLRHRPRNVSPILRTSSKLRRPPRMLSAEDAPAPGATLEVIPDPGAVVPQGDVPAPAPGRQNGLIRGDAPLLSLAPAPRRGTTRRGEPGRAPARPPPLKARRSRRSPGPTRHEKDVSLLEATTRLAVLPTRRSSTSSDELMSS